MIITGNLLVNDDTTTQAVISLSEANQRQVTRALVSNNLCFARFGRGIECRSSDDVAIQGNMVVATGTCTLGIQVVSETSSVDNVSVRDNDVMAEGAGTWNTGIQISTNEPQQIHHVSVVGNSVRGANEGVRFQGAGFQQTPVCALNRIDAGTASPLLGIRNLPEQSVVVGGAASRGGATERSGAGRFIAGLVDDPDGPNGRVTGNVGDIFQRINGGVGSTLYVKERDDGSTSGWVAK